MKSLFRLYVAVVSCTILFSCDESYTTIPFDKSLAASVCFQGYRAEAEGSCDGAVWTGYRYEESVSDIGKVNDEQVRIHFAGRWEETELSLSIPIVSVGGKRFDATLEATTTDAVVEWNGKRYETVPAKVEGWIRSTMVEEAAASTRNSPVIHEYNCGIEIECDVDGKKLVLEITSAKPIDLYATPSEPENRSLDGYSI